MGLISDEIEGWDAMDDDERERLRALLDDLGLHLDIENQPDEFE